MGMDEIYDLANKGVFNAGVEFSRRERTDLGNVTEASREAEGGGRIRIGYILGSF